MQNPVWQAQLRASVRLYLELGAVPGLVQEADALLQRTEAELLDALLAGSYASLTERQRARALLDVAQHQLLDSELQHENSCWPTLTAAAGSARQAVMQ